MAVIASSMGYGLMARDIGVLRDLARMRYLRTAQIEGLHFPSRRVANRRLEVLTANGYADRFRLPTLIGQGSSEYVYCLEEKSGDLLSALDLLDAEKTQIPQRSGRPKNLSLMEHLLAINDFWITLESACRQAGLRIVSFIPEYYGSRTESGGFRRLIAESTPALGKPGELIAFIPDAMFILERNGKQALFFLEIDRGTEKITSTRYAAFCHKTAAYANYHQSGGFKRWGNQFSGFRVLVVTSSDQRLANLVAAGASGLPQLMWFSTKARITQESLFKAIWQVPGTNGLQPLLRS